MQARKPSRKTIRPDAHVAAARTNTSAPLAARWSRRSHVANPWRPVLTASHRPSGIAGGLAVGCREGADEPGSHPWRQVRYPSPCMRDVGSASNVCLITGCGVRRTPVSPRQRPGGSPHAGSNVGQSHGTAGAPSPGHERGKPQPMPAAYPRAVPPAGARDALPSPWSAQVEMYGNGEIDLGATRNAMA